MKNLYHLIVMTAFVGILLTGTIYYLTNAVFEQPDTVAEQCYDGSVIKGDSPVAHFRRSVYQSAASQDLIRAYQYRLFGIVDAPDVLAGQSGFLFETTDEENDYNYLEDYTGNLSFTEEESAAILKELQRRERLYAERGAEYLLVILPNSQTVYSENMPAYLGDIGTTRLNRLEAYLADHDFSAFVNLTDELKSCKQYGPLYNNTENSLNALGLYYTYQSVCERFQPTVMSKTRTISRGDLSFYQHMTTGKAAARRAGLSDVAQNLTISLSNNTKLRYHVQQDDGWLTKTILKPPYDSPDIYETPPLLLQFSNSWERLQLEPFFSNTFLHVTYQTDLTDDTAVYEQAAPRVVMQFIYENELSQLLVENGAY